MKKYDLVHHFLKLPQHITCNEITFYLQFFKNHTYEARLGYLTFDNETWSNPYEDYKECDFLFLFEVIKNESDLEKAIFKCFDFLKKNNLL